MVSTPDKNGHSFCEKEISPGNKDDLGEHHTDTYTIKNKNDLLGTNCDNLLNSSHPKNNMFKNKSTLKENCKIPVYNRTPKGRRFSENNDVSFRNNAIKSNGNELESKIEKNEISKESTSIKDNEFSDAFEKSKSDGDFKVDDIINFKVSLDSVLWFVYFYYFFVVFTVK